MKNLYAAMQIYGGTWGPIGLMFILAGILLILSGR